MIGFRPNTVFNQIVPDDLIDELGHADFPGLGQAV